MTLPKAQERSSWLGILSSKVKEFRQAATDKKALKALMMDVVADGLLADEERDRVCEFMTASGLTQADMSEWRIELYERAITALETRGYTSERIQGIESIQSFLNIHDTEIPEHIRRLNRWKTLVAIRQNGLTPLNVVSIILRKAEKVYWQQAATVFENKVVRRRYEGGSSGVSIRVAKGLSFRVESHRGQMVSDTADVPVSVGDFFITSQRLVFHGDAKSFQTNLEHLIGVQTFRDGIEYGESSKERPRRIIFSEPNGDIVEEILSKVLAQRCE